MGFFDLFKRNKKVDNKLSTSNIKEFDTLGFTGKDFEFLITGDLDIPNDKFDQIMSPNSFISNRIDRDDWIYYQIDNDEFSYSFEPPGIQMTFNSEITFEKAKHIADEVVNNINATGQEAELVILDHRNIYKF